MRRSTALAILAALAGCGRRSSPAPRSPAAPGRAVRIIALGDSLAFGTGASAPRNAFVFQAFLRVLAQHPRSRLDTYAIGGSTAADVLRLQAPRLAHARADIVVICVGGNDVVHRVAATDFARTYAQLVERVRALQPRAAIVCCGVPDVGLSPMFTGTDHDAVTRLSGANDAAIRATARRAGAEFVDLYATTLRQHADVNRFLSEDRFHPSDAGHAQLAAALAPALLRAASR